MSQRPTPVMTIEEAYARLTAPGAPFEIVEQEVLGELVQVFKTRPPHLRYWLEKSAGFGDRECWVFDDGRALTYRDHIRAVASVAHGLRTRFGIGKGDRVGVLGANSLEWVLSFWATTALGGVTCAMNGWWQPDEIVYGLELTKPKVLIVDEKRYQRIADRPIDVPVVVIERDFADMLWDATLDVELPSDPIDEDDAVAILFTSGTTGRPKGAISTHRNLVGFVQISTLSGAARALQFPQPANASAPAQPTNVVSAPLFHVSGLQSAAISGIAHGIRYIWTTGRFDPKKILDITAREKITRMGGITTQVWRILEHPDFDQYDLSHVTAMGGGGSVFSPELQRAMRDKLPNAAANFSIGYGLTECGGLCTMANSGDARSTSRLRRQGDPHCTGRDLRRRRQPVATRRGRQRVYQGAHGDAGLLGQPRGDRRRVLSRSLAEVGRLRLDGRRQSVVPRHAQARHDHPRRREHLSHRDREPSRRASGRGRSGRRRRRSSNARSAGQSSRRAAPGRDRNARELTDWVGAALAYYKVPEFVEIRDEPLPRNATGKVMKHVLTGEAENTMIEE